MQVLFSGYSLLSALCPFAAKELFFRLGVSRVCILASLRRTCDKLCRIMSFRCESLGNGVSL